jgi:hypothetical protein
MLLEAMARLEKVVANRVALPAEPQPVTLDLDKAQREIAAARHDMLDDAGEIAAGADPFGAVAATAGETVSGLTTTTQALQSLASGLRERHPDDPALEQLDTAIGKLHREGWRAELNARRVRAAMAVLSNAAARRAMPAPAQRPAGLDARNLKYFAADEDLFQPIPLGQRQRMTAVVDAIATSETFHFHAEETAKIEAPAAAVAAPEPPKAAVKDKKRIVVVRTTASDIPLAPEETPPAESAEPAEG